jgi:hypothetical protein
MFPRACRSPAALVRPLKRDARRIFLPLCEAKIFFSMERNKSFDSSEKNTAELSLYATNVGWTGATVRLKFRVGPIGNLQFNWKLRAPTGEKR